MSKVLSKIFGGSTGPEGNSFPEPPTSDLPDQAPPIKATRINFPSYNLPEYSNRTAMVIDNLFTPEDCQRLLTAAESKSSWIPAKINGGGGKEYYDNSYRNSERILHDDFELAGWIFDKLRPYLSEIESLPSASNHLRIKGRSRGVEPMDNGAKLVRLNERLRFLKYGPGQFFRPHCDGFYNTDDKKEVSYYTLQIYLSGDKQSLKGGATRFWQKGYQPWAYAKTKNRGVKYLDVDSRLGRVLIFEHAGLMHSGEDVVEGTKISMRTDFMYAENEVRST